MRRRNLIAIVKRRWGEKAVLAYLEQYPREIYWPGGRQGDFAEEVAAWLAAAEASDSAEVLGDFNEEQLFAVFEYLAEERPLDAA